ncbi:uncharacterized protein LOC123412336 isoform X1 [Hordeum vulgare subsp. vulgare]|uniref:uncharacterized protein LOC123412336 isoform X1 n=1 Tax=Hordeum vulgare subsp. vulgare TaxID=112509 RepID=UPI00162B12FA|nr:uncharacterized protein LOC123412336 isoform X1 [Hordeum vulgare subsp. vulgare]
MEEATLLPSSSACEEIGGDESLAVGDEVKRQLRLAGQFIVRGLMQNLIQMISVMFVGHLAELPLAGASMASSFAAVTGFSLLIRCVEGHMVFSESMSMNPTLMATRYPQVLRPVSTNNAMCESSRERMTPRKSNDTSNMFTDDTDKDFIYVDKGEENCVTDKIVPKEGLCFHSEEEAYKLYNAYAKKKGFSVKWTH